MAQDQPAGSVQVQQLLELLAVVTTLSDEAAAIRGAVERAAQALEAEVAAVVVDGRVAAAVGFAAGAVPVEDLIAVGRRERDWIEVRGLDKCQAIAAPWGGAHPGQLIIARWGDEPFTVEEHSLIRGMARVLELTLTMLRTLEAEHRMRERSERQAADNARLVDSLREQERLLLHLSSIQRAISRHDPLPQLLKTILDATQDVLGDEVVGLWTCSPQQPDRATLRMALGLPTRRAPTVPLTEAGAAGEAMRRNDIVTLAGYENASRTIRDLTRGQFRISMAVPVHENGQVAGALVVASFQEDRRFRPEEAQALRVFAQNISLALTDAHTVDRMNQAVLDALTGLASRGLFLERLAEQLSLARPTAVLFIDLDRFKAVNDSLGHATGDELLVRTAERIRAQVRAGDVAGRFGGDEFAIMLGDVAGVEEAVAVADRMGRALAEPMSISGLTLRVDASIGIALSTLGSADSAELMRRADVAMYHAKRHGRGRYQVFTDELLSGFAVGPPPD
ncbi:diguanylate cyclase (GGDEF)-like protein [Allocatelliglobosispora scoriae]|uniref:Diguanylate cyclase (GGDEF)-like protein n=1 Tax=Allocatelliglobosispora scoriae TaxID=643052 RepID=A0A841C2I8_9ACTN|nr:sensor domain-containing diguanylate cyclase [Allocatelliglobosispora scoriae]MBB5873519.1 diguanylate cyclase (GGDEF)-like protein [Allocatelliglobosispora scoriae]